MSVKMKLFLLLEHLVQANQLLCCLAGLENPDRGIVSYNMKKDFDKRGHIPAGFVFQDPALFPWLTVRENVSIVLDRLNKKEREEELDNRLNMLGLMGFQDCYPREISTGIKKKVSLCRALASHPQVLILDDPFSGLDTLTAESISGELLRIWAQDSREISAMIIVSNSTDETLLLADKVFLLSAEPGRITNNFLIDLPRPRHASQPGFIEIENKIRNTFGEMHLDKLTLGRQAALPTVRQTQLTHATERKPGEGDGKSSLPLINTSLILVEGLLNRLGQEEDHLDIYDLCDEMGEPIDTLLPAVASAEILSFLNTPGTKLVLTPVGRRFTQERDVYIRLGIFREACLNLKIIYSIYNQVYQQIDQKLDRQKSY